MFYSEEDMIKSMSVVNNVTPFERHACKAMAFGDNLALSATFVTLANGLHEVDKQTSEANNNKSVYNDSNNESVTALSTLSTEGDALAVALLQSLAPVLQEV